MSTDRRRIVIELQRRLNAVRSLPRRRLIVCLVAGLWLTHWGSLAGQPLPPSHLDNFTGHPRLIVISDIGNEPDDQMSLVRLLLYSNEIDIEALIASTSTWQKAAVHPETMRALIQAYGNVRPNLLLHAKGWPPAEELDHRVFSGTERVRTGGYRLGQDVGGSARRSIRAADRDDSRPLWVSVWGGVNTLAQALLHVRATRGADSVERFVQKLRVYSISDQDDAGPWIRREFPNLFYIVQPSTQTGDGILLRDLDRDQRRCFLPQRRRCERDDSDERVAGCEHPRQRAAWEVVSEIRFHHGR